MLSPDEVKAIEPVIDTTIIKGAIHLRDGGAAPHHAAMKGYLKAARRLGVKVEYGRRVTATERRGDRVVALQLGDERIPCDELVIAAGAYSVEVGKLAEAEVPYDQVHEMEDINAEFGQTDVAIILGANDVVNPAALQKGSAIYGMPILEAYKARTVIVNKRSMAAGYAGLDNELFYMDKTMMVFGDAKKVVEDMVKAVE